MLLLAYRQTSSANSHGFSSTRNQARNTSWPLLAPASRIHRRLLKSRRSLVHQAKFIHAMQESYSSPLLTSRQEPSYECAVYIRPPPWPLAPTPPAEVETEAFQKDISHLAQGSMDAARGNRTFEDFDPAIEWSRNEEADAVKISLPGFKREEIRVLVDNHRHLRTRGERPVAGTRWSRFQKDFKLPDNCNVDGIRAKFENEKLTITLPKTSHSPTQAAAAPAPVPAPPMPLPEPRRPAIAVPQQPPPALPEPARPAPATVPTTSLTPAPSQRLPPAPSQKPQPAERRPSLPPRLPSVPTPAEFEPLKKSEPAAAVPSMLKEQVKETKKPSLEEEEEKRMEREAMGKMEEDRKMTEEEEEGAGAAMGEMEMVSRPRPMAANRGLLVNVAVAVVVLVGITVYVWHTLRGAGDHGHGGMGARSYGDEM